MKDRAMSSNPGGAGDEECDADIPEDPLRDLTEEGDVRIDFHMDESTIVYECVEKYLATLNNDQRLRPDATSEERMIDEALLCFETDIDKCNVRIWLMNIFAL